MLPKVYAKSVDSVYNNMQKSRYPKNDRLHLPTMAD